MKKLLLALLYASLLGACGRQEKVSVSNENILYDKVAELGASGAYQEVIEQSDSILQLQIGDSLRAYIMLERMVAMGNMGNMRHATAYADTVIDYGKKANIGEVVINALTIKGAGYRRNAQTDSALIYYQQALDQSIKEENTEYEQYICDMLSILYTETSRTKEALMFSRRSLELAREMKDTTAMLSAIATIGSIYMEEGKYRKLLDVQLPYAPMIKEDIPGGYVAKFFTPVIKAYLELNNLDSTRYYVSLVEPFLRQLPEHHQASVAILNAKAALLSKEHKYREVMEIYNRIDSLGTHGKPADGVLYERAVCLNKLGDSRAFGMMEKAYFALDSIREKDTEAKMGELAAKYETLQREVKIKQLGMERLTWLVVSIVLAVVILIVVLWMLYKREKYRQKMVLEKQNTYIRGLEAERERIAKELHDGICNEMLAMSFTLADDEKALEQIQAITAKTRRLSHELMPPQFKDGNICQLLMSYVMMISSSHPETNITITDEGSYAWETLPAEHSFELYRMVQEAVGNALKHAAPTYISITLNGTADHYSVTVENDGAGNNDDADTDTGIGKRTLRARAASIGASAKMAHEDGKYKIIIQH